ncbi:unnamed protein product [Mesocestoides corti]|uniref:Uncharacterized protein n=1 Tax=Mesocestoides corti TaxID=53468 RepID=A0A158QTR5_MESCO|nr:unnamed protein product [Mesocestoides corti]
MCDAVENAASHAVRKVVKRRTNVKDRFALYPSYLNDLTGSYSWSMRLCALWLFVGTLVFLLEFPIRRAIRIPDPTEPQHEQLSDNMTPTNSPWCRHFGGPATLSVEDLTPRAPSIVVASVPPSIAKAGLSDSTIPFVCSQSDEGERSVLLGKTYEPAGYPELPTKDSYLEPTQEEIEKIISTPAIDGEKLNQLIDLINQMPKTQNPPYAEEGQAGVHLSGTDGSGHRQMPTVEMDHRVDHSGPGEAVIQSQDQKSEVSVQSPEYKKVCEVEMVPCMVPRCRAVNKGAAQQDDINIGTPGNDAEKSRPGTFEAYGDNSYNTGFNFASAGSYSSLTGAVGGIETGLNGIVGGVNTGLNGITGSAGSGLNSLAGGIGAGLSGSYAAAAPAFTSGVHGANSGAGVGAGGLNGYFGQFLGGSTAALNSPYLEAVFTSAPSAPFMSPTQPLVLGDLSRWNSVPTISAPSDLADVKIGYSLNQIDEDEVEYETKYEERKFACPSSHSPPNIIECRADLEEYNRQVSLAKEEAEKRRKELISQRDAEVARRRAEAERNLEEEIARRKADAQRARDEEVRRKIADAERIRKQKEQQLTQLFSQKLKALRDAEAAKRAQYEKSILEISQREGPIRQQIALAQSGLQELEIYKAQISAQEVERRRQIVILSEQLKGLRVPSYSADTGSEKNLLAEYCQQLSDIKCEEKERICAAEATPLPKIECPEIPEVEIPNIPKPEAREIKIPKIKIKRESQRLLEFGDIDVAAVHIPSHSLQSNQYKCLHLFSTLQWLHPPAMSFQFHQVRCQVYESIVSMVLAYNMCDSQAKATRLDILPAVSQLHAAIHINVANRLNAVTHIHVAEATSLHQRQLPNPPAAELLHDPPRVRRHRAVRSSKSSCCLAPRCAPLSSDEECYEFQATGYKLKCVKVSCSEEPIPSHAPPKVEDDCAETGPENEELTAGPPEE